jgi:hypothetical protein
MEAERFFNDFIKSYFISLKRDDNVREKFKMFYETRHPFWFEEFINYLEDSFYENLKYSDYRDWEELYKVYYKNSDYVEKLLRDFAENLYKEFKE